MAAVAARLSNLGAGFPDKAARPARVVRACHWAWAALSLAELVDAALTRRSRRGWIVADAALCTATSLVTLREAGDDSLTVRYAQMMSLTVTAGATADFAPIAAASVATAVVSWSWSLVGRRRRHTGRRVPVVAASLEPTLTYVAIAMVARRLRSMDAELDALRAEARHEAESSAAETERDRQHRLLHDTALQTLEAVAGDWYSDATSLRVLAAADAAQLRRALEETTVVDLESDLADLVDTYRRAGLDVAFEAHGLERWAGPGTEEITAATREALVNALKHAGPAATRVVAAGAHDAVTVTISDDGGGFDPTTTAGYGIEHSMRRRLAEAGGRAEIRSTPGIGTVVHLWVPKGPNPR